MSMVKRLLVTLACAVSVFTSAYVSAQQPQPPACTTRDNVMLSYSTFEPDARGELWVTDLNTHIRVADLMLTGSERWSPDGSEIAYGSFGRTGLIGITAVNVARLESRVVVDASSLEYIPNDLFTEAGINTFEWSPDGTKIAFVLSGQQLYVVNADGTGLTRLADDLSMVSKPVWAPDGSNIIYADDSGLYRIALNGNSKVLYAYEPLEPWSYGEIDYRYLPDGTVAFSDNRSFTSVHIQPNGTMEQTSALFSVSPVWSNDGTRYVSLHGEYGYAVYDASGSVSAGFPNFGFNTHGFSWSTDDSRIAVAGPQAFYLVNADGTSLCQISGPNIGPQQLIRTLLWRPGVQDEPPLDNGLAMQETTISLPYTSPMTVVYPRGWQQGLPGHFERPEAGQNPGRQPELVYRVENRVNNYDACMMLIALDVIPSEVVEAPRFGSSGANDNCAPENHPLSLGYQEISGSRWLLFDRPQNFITSEIRNTLHAVQQRGNQYFVVRLTVPQYEYQTYFDEIFLPAVASLSRVENVEVGEAPTPTFTPAPFSVEVDRSFAEAVAEEISRLQAAGSHSPLRVDARIMTVAALSSVASAEDDYMTASTRNKGLMLEAEGYLYTGAMIAETTVATLDVADIYDEFLLVNGVPDALRSGTYADIGVGIAQDGTTGLYHVTIILANAKSGCVDNVESQAVQAEQGAAIVRLLNEARVNAGLGPLTQNSVLDAAGLQHSRDMATNDFLRHMGSDGSAPHQRALANGYPTDLVGENILFQFELNPTVAFNSWWESPGHHANMMLPHYDEIGIGVACDPSTGNYYYSMELGTPSQSEGLDQTAALPEPLQLGEVADEAPTGSDISGFGTAPTPQVSAVHCPGTLPSRLLAGGEGRIIPTGSPNRLRNQPSLNGAILTRVPGGGVFAILDGPVCRDNYAWWQVNYGGFVGWTAEADAVDYWIDPFPIDVAPIAVNTSAGALCQVQPGVDVNHYTGPGTSWDIDHVATGVSTHTVVGFAVSTSGFRWWKLDDNSWVRDDMVSVQGECQSVPTVSP